MNNDYCFWNETKGAGCKALEGQRKCSPCLEIGRMKDRELALESELEQLREQGGK